MATRKKTTKKPAPKGKRARPKLWERDEIAQELRLVGGLCVALSIFNLFSLYSSQMGVLGEFLGRLQLFLYGITAPFQGVLLLLFGGVLISNLPPRNSLRSLLLFLTLSLSSLVLAPNDPMTTSLRWEKSLLMAKDGGFLGQHLGGFMELTLGTVGSLLVLLLIFLGAIYWTLTGEQRSALVHSFRELGAKGRERATAMRASATESGGKTAEKKSPSKRGRGEIRPSSETFILEDPPEGPFSGGFSDADANEGEELQVHHYKEVEPVAKATPVTAQERAEFEREIHQGEGEQRDYQFPDTSLLKEQKSSGNMGIPLVKENARIIEKTLDNFNIPAKVTAIHHGPTITSYEIQPDPGIKLSKITSLSDNLSFQLASSDIRIEAPIPGKRAVGIEVPNRTTEAVGLREILESSEFKSLDSKVPLSLGKDVSGNTIISSIDKMPHLLIAGATGSGKSVCINTILMGILYKATPKDVRLILIDPKVVELGNYNGIPHLLIPVVTDPKKAAFALAWAVDEMEKRYKKFAQLGVRDIKGYNQKIQEEATEEEGERMSQIVIIVDELSDLMMVSAKEVEDYITRLAQMARAAGIHLILATQRPSVDVITGTIKANIPSRIAFSVSSSIDSRTILDMSGGEKLLGKGDMLFYPSYLPKPKRIQGAFVSDEEIETVLEFVKDQSPQEVYSEEIVASVDKKIESAADDRDELLDEAVEIVLTQEQASISFLQRKLKVGYARAARIVDQLEEVGVIGPHEGSKPRKLLITREEYQRMKSEEE
ncbi:MAG: DNA translocase FtsK [Tissierellia bacterium]|nr:DNA translocase FtsK [Tissierellia bacterium]